MNPFTLNRGLFLRACSEHTETPARLLSRSLFWQPGEDDILTLIAIAHESAAITPPQPLLTVLGYPVGWTHVLLTIYHEATAVRFAGLPVRRSELYPSLPPDQKADGPEVLCEIVQAVLKHCDETLARVPRAVRTLELQRTRRSATPPSAATRKPIPTSPSTSCTAPSR